MSTGAGLQPHRAGGGSGAGGHMGRTGGTRVGSACTLEGAPPLPKLVSHMRLGHLLNGGPPATGSLFSE